ncbi:MAG TPA: queuosine precursor transporter [Bacillota bacterium]|nr:queuosine precursor transporter [Bacillota bacterium]
MKVNSQRFSPLFLGITSIFVSCLLISNIIAGKLISIAGLPPLPAAVILFPITYIFGDILTEVYGFRNARLAIWIGFAANLLMTVFFTLTIILPYPSFWKGQSAYASVLGMTPRIVAASTLAYLAGEFSNSMVLSRLKIWFKGRRLWIRTIGSTVIGEGLDTIVFISLGFAGTMPLAVLLGMMGAQYLWKVTYETFVTPLTYLAIRWVKHYEGIDVYDYTVNYNPFSLKVGEEHE